MTVLELVNRVLRRLREDTVTSLVETPYSTMLVDLLHDVHQECVNDYDWSSMDHVIDIPVDASQRVLDLSRTESAGGDIDDTGIGLKIDSTLRYDTVGRPMVWLFQDSSDEDGCRMLVCEENYMESLYQEDRGQTNDDPSYISFRAHPDRDGIEATIWPPPTSTKHIRAKFWTPESEVDISTDVARTLLVPARPLVLGTYLLALNERGEELGEPGNLAERRFYESLSAAIEMDTMRRQQTNRYEFRRD